MTEMDAFERRVAETLRWYADDVTPAVDAADVARRAALAHPRRRKGAIAWGPLTVPRLAWVPLLLAGLLTVMVGGLLITGSQPEQKLSAVVPVFACPPGTNPDEPGPVDQARPPGIHWTPAPAFDRRAGKLVAVASAEVDGTPETWTFDVCTNTWTQMHPDREPPSFEHGYLVYDVDSDVTVGVPSTGDVWTYDVEANTWTEKGRAKGRPGFYDPVSGLVVAATFESTDLWNYDVETDTWAPIPHTDGPQNLQQVTYDASVDRMVAAATVEYTEGVVEPETWLLDLRTGTWLRSGAEAPVLITGIWAVPAVAYDEMVEQTVFLGNARWAAYDAAADRWDVLSEDGDESLPGPMVYDSVNGRLVGWRLGGTAVAGDVVAFELATREWAVLLAPSDGQPAPNPSPTPLSVVVTSNVAYESSNPVLTSGKLDIHAPAEPGPWPVVVMFHGGGGDKSDLRQYAHRVADLGFVVFSATWGAGVPIPETYEEALPITSQAACAVEFARAHAAEYGGDPTTMIVFGHSFGANMAAMIAFARRQPSAGCLGSTTLGPIDALVTWEGDWLLQPTTKPEHWDESLAGDPRLLDGLTPSKYLAEHKDLKVVMLVSETPKADIDPDRPLPDAETKDAFFAPRDPSGVMRAQLEANGALGDGLLDLGEAQGLLFSILEAQGNPVSLEVMPGSNHLWLSDAGWEVFLAAFPKAVAQD